MWHRWAKTDSANGSLHLLPYHCLDVAAVLSCGLARNPILLAFFDNAFGWSDPEQTRALLLTLATLHDAGKCASSFQALNREAAQRLGLPPNGAGRYELRHDALGHALLRHLITDGSEPLPPPFDPAAGDWDEDTWPALETLLAATTGHHGIQPAACEFAFLRGRGLASRADLAAAAELVRFAMERFGWRRGVPALKNAARASYLLNGVITLADWLGSGEDFTYVERRMEPAEYWEKHALRSAKAAVERVGPMLFRPLSPRAAAGFGDLWPGWTPSDLQATVDRLFAAETLPEGPLLAVIEDLPGSGKTEAGDLIAQRLIAGGRVDGVYVGLPTMATADAAFTRKAGFAAALWRNDAATVQTVLAHGKANRRPPPELPTRAGEEEKGDDGAALDWFRRSTRRALLADLGVGTVDQALAGALRGRHAAVRLAGLWRKLLVVDEVHAYDDYMQELLQALLRHQGWLGFPAVLMSATLPSAQRARLIAAYAEGAARHDPRWRAVADEAAASPPGPYPLLTLASGDGLSAHPVRPAAGPGLRPVRVEAAHELKTVVARIGDWLDQGRSVIWFRNTVADAIAAWELFSGRALLYHARFLPAHRAALEERLLEVAGKEAAPEARHGRLVIATQAAEQSLDLDFDELVSDLAPADSVIQRLGRRRRHLRTADGRRSEDGRDHRPDSPALLFTPRPDDDAGEHWYAAAFRGAASIYPDDARLWLTARALIDPASIPGRTGESPELRLADDLRPLLEHVYSDTDRLAHLVPAGPMKRHEKAGGATLAERSQGRQAALAFRNGLLADWRTGNEVLVAGEDENPSTRLGDSHSVILAVIEGDDLRFFDETGDALDASECRCPIHLETPEADRPLRLPLSERLPDRERRRLDGHQVVFLKPEGDRYRGTAMAHPASSRSEPVLREVVYDSVRGLSIASSR